MQRIGARLIAAALVAGVAAPAAAEVSPWGDRAFLSANVTFRLSPTTMTPIDIGGGARIAGNLGAGGAFTQFPETETAPGRTEKAIHLHAVWMLPISQKLDVAVLGGPSIVYVEQTSELASLTERAFGWHVGGDGTYFLTPTVGIGGMLRYVSAPENLDFTGLQFGMGVRLRFP
jgi:hypothetical protein